ncbi:MAG: response regulator [Oscillatoriales cyanobacterium]|nr:MAG: response regulator [Oscillatoriales cyanobacterium]
MESALQPILGTYDWFLVFASLVIAIVASYTALDVAGRLRLAMPLGQRWLWLVSGSLAMGIGIWSMHFVGMLALKLPILVQYDITTTALSLVWAIAASGMALHAMSRQVMRWSLVVGGACIGLAIVAMHYTGMAAMRIPGEINHSPVGVAGAVAIALGASYGAVWLSFRLAKRSIDQAMNQAMNQASVVDWSWESLGSATVMGLGIGGMHYMAMTATRFQAPAMAEQIPPLDRELPLLDLWNLPLGNGQANLTSASLAVDVALGAVVILAIALVISTLQRIFDRQRMREQSLTASELRFRLLLDYLPTGVLLVDPQGKILSCNPMAARLLGTSPELLQGKAFSAGLPLLNPNGVALGQGRMPLQQVLDLAQEGTAAGLEAGEMAIDPPSWHRSAPNPSDPNQSPPAHQWRLANTVLSLDQGNQRRWLLANADPILNEAGEVERIVCALTDITDRRLAELALKKTAKRESAIARVIQRMRRTLDLKTILDTTTSELLQIVECDRVLVYRFEPDWSGRIVSESVATGWKPVAANPEIEQIAVDRPDCVIQTINSIDDPQVLIQDTYLQDTHGGAYQSVKSYRCVSDIYRCNFDTCYLSLLEALQAKAYIIVPIFCREQLWGLLACYQNNQPRDWAEPEISSVVSIAEQFGVAVQQAELLAQTQQQTIELSIAKDEADRANKAKSTFLAHMSHELRTPLNAILGFTQLMARDSSLSPTQRQQTNIINRSGEHLLTLINSILDMSKIEAEQMTLQVEQFDLHRLLHALHDLLLVKAQDKGLSLVFEPDDSLPQYVATDQNRLRQILLNLLGNALKFTNLGQITLKAKAITDHALRPIGMVIDPQRAIGLEFAIIDTGPGLNAAELNCLFKPFEQTTAGLRSGQGTGLGLSISREFARLLGGEITVNSQPLKGTTFTVTVAAQRVDALPQPPSQQPITGLAVGQPPYRILVVDDDENSRLLLIEFLNSIGFITDAALNGRMAIDLWQQHRPHAIFMDMKMPGLDGYAASRIIKDQPNGANTLIIALTASAFEHDRAAILQAGCDDLLCKPFNFTDLLTRLGQHLGLQYTYAREPNPTPPAKVISRSDESALIPLLAALPTDWRSQFRSAVTRGSDIQALQLLEQLPDTAEELRALLTGWLDALRFDRVIELLDRVSLQTQDRESTS